MNAATLTLPVHGLGDLLRESLKRQHTLTLFALFMWAAMIPTVLALGLDERTLRGVSVWAKPLKFMASLGLFAFTTAWFVGLIEPAARHSRAVRGIAAVIVGVGRLEVGYIVLQSMLARASHFNFDDRMHAVVYQLMGIGALALCITQGVLARQITRHGRADLDPDWRLAVLIGLWMTLLLGAGAGAVLSGVQPPAGAGLPAVGWHKAADLRPAHFLGIHAQQLPAAGGPGTAALAGAKPAPRPAGLCSGLCGVVGRRPGDGNPRRSLRAATDPRPLTGADASHRCRGQCAHESPCPPASP